MLGFWEFLHSEKNLTPGLLFFVGMGFGLLAKGPIICVLSFPPLFLWCILHQISFKKIFKFLGYWGVLNTIDCSSMVLPNGNQFPGFIDYFLLGEHFLRFIDPSWSGDKNTVFPKQQPLGIIWVSFYRCFALVFCSFGSTETWVSKNLE